VSSRPRSDREAYPQSKYSLSDEEFADAKRKLLEDL